MPSARNLKTRADLRRAQLWATTCLKRPWSKGDDWIPGVILAWDMGAGKTAAVLFALLDLYAEKIIPAHRKVLIVAPKLVAQTTWPDEIEEEWEELRAFSYEVLRAEDDDPRVLLFNDLEYARIKHQSPILSAQVSDLDGYGRLIRRLAAEDARREADRATTEFKTELRRRLAQSPARLHIINKEGLAWLWDYYQTTKTKWPYEVLVVDEASMLKGGVHRVKRDKNLKRRGPAPLSRFGIVAKMAALCKTVFEMTGTPAPNGIRNLFGLLYPIDFGERLEKSKARFNKRWFVHEQYTHKWHPKPGAEAEIMSRIKDVMFSLGPDDYPKLPGGAPVPVIRKVPLSPDVLEQYERFAREAVSEDYDVEAVNAGVLYGKLLQFANGSMYREDGHDVHIHDAKLDMLEQLVEELEDEPLFVAYSFEFDKVRIKKRFPHAVILDEGDPRDIKRRWNAGQIKMLLAHPLSAGHGLNFQHGGHHAVWYGLTADLELFLQFNKRLSRPGQTHPVWLHIIIAEDTKDEEIIPIYLNPKQETQNRILEAVRVVDL